MCPVSSICMNRRCSRARLDPIFFLALGGVLSVFTFSTHADDECSLDLQFIDARTFPLEQTVDGDAFGGISGIDYDAGSNVWYLVSDDRSDHAPARLFTAAIHFDRKALPVVELQHSVRFKTSAYDPETIRFDTRTGNLLVAGEGDTEHGLGPWLQRVTLDGRLAQSISLPAQFSPGKDSGPRPNQSIEGVTFTPKRDAMWIALEAPLLEDGERADVEHTGDVRLTKLDPNGRMLAQFVYRTDKAIVSEQGRSVGIGVSEILTLGDQQLLVLERSGTKHSDGRLTFDTNLYCADLSGATDVSALSSLREQTYKIATKRLLFDSSQRKLHDGTAVENLEGMSWGPPLSNETRSLIIASDNNFFPGTPTQFLLFGVQKAKH